METLEIIEKAIQVVGALAIVARFTPTPKDDIVLMPLYKLLQFLAMNHGHAENKVKPGEK